jgi:cytochrome c oxidase cbb3-type subunit IV
MHQTYKVLAEFAQTWGLAYFVTVFLSVLLYALWPANKSRFEEAGRMPLQED